ncbi:MAG TPA: FAD-binding oxidoreductase [Ilumatobacteraceae bacterium]|nr:FAD-binding oxidoreductase [Ilumatobacteraceae bacterium]HRB03690.1 FAD-binding oxidoreductase [Ilumatobacteraceae bacterium]
MSLSKVDVVVIGGGIAGASAAWSLAEHASVMLVEQAASAGFHATGRSASVLSETSGHSVVCALAAASRGFFESPPTNFVDHALLGPRGLLWVGQAGDAAALDHLAQRARSVAPTVRRLTPDETLALVPHFRPAAIAGGSTFEPDAMAIDTDALLQGYLRGLRQRGGHMYTSSAAIQLSRSSTNWTVVCEDRGFEAAVVVNAAGAWGDVVATRAGVAPLGLEPRRRTACLAVLADVDPSWPLVMDVAGRYYAEPESGGLLVSPADESPSEPCDAQAEEIDVALALDRLAEATTLPLRSVRRAWAGLRTFSPDGAPVVGEDPAAAGFFWLVGQAGAGIKTAPAMAAILDALVRGAGLPEALIERSIAEADLSPARFR